MSETLRDPDDSIQQINKTTFPLDVSKIVVGAAVAQAIGILSTPLLTRLYAPETFGQLALFMSITSILGVVTCMRYELSIMLPKNDSEAANLLGVSLAFALLVAVLTTPFIWWGRESALRWFNAPHLALYLWLLPITVLTNGISLALNYWNSRTKQFGRLSVARVTSSAASTTVNLGAGYAGYATAGALIGGYIGGQALATALLSWQIWRDDGNVFRRSFRWRDMLAGMKQYRRFPIYSTWSALLNILSAQLPIFLLALYFSPVLVGFYALCYRILSIPMTFIGNAIAQVFFQRAAQAKHDGTLPTLITKTFQRLLLLASMPFLLLAIIGPELFTVIFGKSWIVAGVYAQILAPWFFFVFLGSPMSTLNSILGLQEADLFFNIILIISRICSLVIGSVLGSAYLALMLFASSGAIMWGLFCFYLVSKSGVRPLRFAKLSGLQLLVAFLFLLPVITAKWFLTGSAFLILSVAALTIILYYTFVIFRDDEIRSLFIV